MTKQKNICNKCNKKFSSSHNLTQHMNRKIPCNIILNCVKCNKVFPTHQQLEQHTNRKTSCVKNIVLDKESIKHNRELAILDKKLELEKQRLELEKEKTKRKNEPKTIINNIHNTVISTTINVINYNKENFIRCFIS